MRSSSFTTLLFILGLLGEISAHARLNRACLEQTYKLVAEQRDSRRLSRQALRKYDPEFSRLPAEEVAQRTVEYAEGDPKVEGAHGSSYAFELKGPRWFSSFGITDHNPDGDPFYVRLTLGSRVAGFLGIKFPTKKSVVLPGADVINWAIDRYNHVRAGMRRQTHRIAVRYYEASGKMSMHEYLVRFAARLELPIAHELRLHDTTYHLPTVLIPEAQLQHARTQVKCYLEFRAKLLSDVSRLSGVEQARVQKWITTLDQSVSDAIDQGTGNFSRHAGRVDARGQSLMYEGGHERLTHDGSSAARLIESMIGLGSSQFGLSAAVLESARDFARTAREKPEYQQQLTSDPKQFAGQVKAQRNALEATVLVLKASAK